MNIKLLYLYITLSIFSIFNLSAIELPYRMPVTKFSKHNYKAGRQTWDIDYDKYGIIYFANSEGLLTNNHGYWELHKVPGDKGIRSLKVTGDTIWVADRAIGHFTRDQYGELNYSRAAIKTSSEVWDIESTDRYIYFQQKVDILRYDKDRKSWDHFPSSSTYNNLFKIDNKVWCSNKDGYVGPVEKISNRYSFKVDAIKDEEVRETIVFKDHILFTLLSGSIISVDKISGKRIKNSHPTTDGYFSAAKNSESKLFWGSISDGLILEDNGKRSNINYDTDRIDNTILSIKITPSNKIWLGLNYGIAYVESSLKTKLLFENSAIYDVVKYQNTIYIATNNGCYRFNTTTEQYELVPGTAGQIWSLELHNNKLYLAHNIGLLELDSKNRLRKLYDKKGISSIVFLDNKNIALETYSDIILYSLETDSSKKITNSSYLHNIIDLKEGNRTTIYSKMQNNKVCKIEFDSTTQTSSKSILDQSKNIFKFSDAIYIEKDKLFRETDSDLEEVNNMPFKDEKSIQHIIQSKDKRDIIAYINNQVIVYHKLPDGQYIENRELLAHFNGDLVEDGEAIKFIDGKLYLLTDHGLYSFDINSENKEVVQHPIIYTVNSSDKINNITIKYPMTYLTEDIKLYKNHISFSVGYIDSKYKDVDYSYKLEPTESTFSNWTKNKTRSYSNLKGGDYTLLVKCKINGIEKEAKHLSFTVDTKWHETTTGFVIILSLFITFITTFAAFAYIKRSQRKLKQVHLSEQVSLKNKQTIDLMDLIRRRNIFLNTIKYKLSTINSSNAERIIKMIDNEQHEQNKTFTFFEFFSEGNQEFISSLKEKHDYLTSNDLRLALFIKIGMTSKNISELTNISITSVDKARYRLRKKMNMLSEESLTEYLNSM